MTPLLGRFHLPEEDRLAQTSERLRRSALFLLLPSPTYLRSQYCREECSIFEATIADRRARLGASFVHELFAIRSPVVPIDGNEHWELFPAVADIAFCDDSETFALNSPEFEKAFRRLVDHVVHLLGRIRGQSAAVFLHPSNPEPELASAHDAVANELAARGYRVLPDRMVNLPGQLRESALAVFLLGAKHDGATKELADLAAQRTYKPWLVW